MFKRFEYESEVGIILDVDHKDPGGVVIMYIVSYIAEVLFFLIPGLILFTGKLFPTFIFCLCAGYLHHLHFYYYLSFKKDKISPLKYVRQAGYNIFFFYFLPYLIIVLFFILNNAHLNILAGLKYFQSLILKLIIALTLSLAIYFQGSFIMDLVNYHRVVKISSKMYISLFVLLYLMVGILFGIFYLLNPNSLNLNDSKNPALDTIYFSFVTLATTGYGDITPASTYAKIISIIENITGLILTAYVIVFIMSIKKTKT